MAADKITEPDQGVVYVERRGNGLAVAALVCGIVGTVLGFIPILFFVAWALGITAFVLGLIGRRRAKDPNIGRKTMATWGVILGVASFGLGIAGYVILQDVFSDTTSELEQLQQDLDEPGTYGEGTNP